VKGLKSVESVIPRVGAEVPADDDQRPSASIVCPEQKRLLAFVRLRVRPPFAVPDLDPRAGS
jgi:hypothetical protein